MNVLNIFEKFDRALTGRESVFDVGSPFLKTVVFQLFKVLLEKCHFLYSY